MADRCPKELKKQALHLLETASRVESEGWSEPHMHERMRAAAYNLLALAPAAAVEARRPAHPVKRILLVDDEEALRDSVAFFLTSSGFEVSTASNGKQALEACEAQRPDLVITDLIMPDMEGVETIVRLREDFGDLPIIAMSGGWQAAEVDLLELATELGATQVLAKPFDCDDLLVAVSRCTGD